jgi:hypothetical protein
MINRPHRCFCEVCGRQIVPRDESTKFVAPGLHPKAGFNGNGFCDECGKDEVE